MESQSPSPRRTLIVANLTAATPILLQEVERRADEEPTTFFLLIPSADSKKTSDWTLENAIRLLSRAADSPVEGKVGGGDAFESVREALAEGSFDDIVVSTLPKRASEWLRKDLPTRLEALGVPVTVVTPPEEPSALKAFTDSFSAKST
jgi:hypothetical protein